MKLTFEFPRLVCAKKNRYRFERGKMRLDAKALKDRKALAYAAVLEVFKLKRNPVFIDDDFRLEVIHLVRSKTLTITVETIGPRPKGRTGRDRV